MSHSLFNLAGRTALVTGSSRGLGRAIAEGLCQAGARVIVNGLDAVRASTVVDQMRARGLSADAAAFDVTKEVEVTEAFARFDRDGIAIDILVNNAGIQFKRPIVDLDTADFRRIVDTNLTSVFVISREAARRMLSRGYGKIINIGSMLSQRARPGVAPYAASKGGLKLLTQTMAVEWGPLGLQANAIAPGYFDTDLNQALVADRAFDSWVKARTPAGRWGQPDDLMGAAVFLASDASNFVNGHMLCVDGGMMAAL